MKKAAELISLVIATIICIYLVVRFLRFDQTLSQFFILYWKEVIIMTIFSVIAHLLED
jgi:hypothetical protein